MTSGPFTNSSHTVDAYFIHKVFCPLVAGCGWVFLDEMYTVTRVPRDLGDYG